MKQTTVTGEQSDADNLDMNPVYQQELEEMAEDFLETQDPEFFDLMRAVQNGERSIPRGRSPSTENE